METLADIQTPYALRGGQLVHISEFLVGGMQPDCLCPACAQPLTARVGKIRVPHFSHPAAAFARACNPEKLLHEIGKRLLEQKVRRVLEEGIPFPVCWDCAGCGERHEEDAVNGIRSLCVEKDLGTFRPDLSLHRPDGEAATIFEVVVTHPPTPAALAFYREKNIKVWEVPLRSFDDVKLLESRLALRDGAVAVQAADDYCQHAPVTGVSGRPPAFTLTPTCSDLQCEGYGKEMNPRQLRVIALECYRCSQKMPAAFAWQGGEDRLDGPETFTTEEVARARAQGVNLEDRTALNWKPASMSPRTTPANVCPHCPRHISPRYNRDYLSRVQRGRVVGCFSYGCGVCGTAAGIGSTAAALVAA